MRTLILGTVLVLALAACAPHSSDDDLRARLRPFIGQPFTAYLQATGSTPSSYYDTADGRRHFVFERSSVMTFPGYSNLQYGIDIPSSIGTVRCSITVEARRVAEITSPDAFVVEGLTAIGMC